MGEQSYKGPTIIVFTNRTRDGISDIPVNTEEFNAISVQVLVSGTDPSATVTVKQSDGAGGIFLPAPDPQSVQAAVTANKSFDCIVGFPWVRIELSGVTGTFADGQGFTVKVTPYKTAGQTTININNTASQNLAQVGGTSVSLGQKTMASSLPVTLASDQSALSAETELPAAAALADGAANPTTPTVGSAKLGYNGATWERERIATVFKNIAGIAVTAGTPVDIWTPSAGKKFRLLGWALSLSVAGSVILIDDATEILRTPLMAAGVGLVSGPMGNGILSTTANNKLKINVTASGNVSGYVFGVEE